MIPIAVILVAVGLGVAAAAVVRTSVAAATSSDALAVLDYERPVRGPRIIPGWGTFANVVRRVTPKWWLARMSRNATLAGLQTIEGPLGSKLLCGVAGLLVGSLLSVPAAVVALIVGWIGPDAWIARAGRRRQEAIRRSMPETLDLLTIAVQSGLGLDGAIALVADRLPGPLSEELLRSMRELQLGSTRKEALIALRERTDVSELSAFVQALIQADALGSPLADVLRAQAAHMRMLRRQRAREAAAKTPVKLLMPLLLGIFPSLFVVVMGPGVIAIIRAFAR